MPGTGLGRFQWKKYVSSRLSALKVRVKGDKQACKQNVVDLKRNPLATFGGGSSGCSSDSVKKHYRLGMRALRSGLPRISHSADQEGRLIQVSVGGCPGFQD